VGSNGKWYASGWNNSIAEGPDWGFMADSLEGDDGTYPLIDRHYIVTATVTVPDPAPELVAGEAAEESK
jgi:hypothetical protein